VRVANGHGSPAADAFEALYRRHRDWVANAAYRFTRDRDLALDVMQDVFMCLLGKFPGFVLTAKLTTFLYPVIKHTSQEALRKAGRYQSASDSLLELPAPQVADDGDDCDIKRILTRLPGHQREVLLLRFVDGMTLEEISLALGIPVGTVKSRAHNAIRTLRADPATKIFFEA